MSVCRPPSEGGSPAFPRYLTGCLSSAIAEDAIYCSYWLARSFAGEIESLRPCVSHLTSTRHRYLLNRPSPAPGAAVQLECPPCRASLIIPRNPSRRDVASRPVRDSRLKVRPSRPPESDVAPGASPRRPFSASLGPARHRQYRPGTGGRPPGLHDHPLPSGL